MEYHIVDLWFLFWRRNRHLSYQHLEKVCIAASSQ